MIEQTLKKRGKLKKPDRPERLNRPDRRDKLEKLNRPDKQDRPDRRNSLEIFRKFYRIGREKLMNSKARLIESSLPQPIPQKCGMKGGE